ncbi:PHD finger protein 12-like isoform X2 [Dreissena polymorpha]|uniref:PHD finger protein 12-like isoform X2 n=1 Tax=Dreissena polymorpha TaxID=45954 RepID=UPI0022646527|nr:PHD finger protein 12-like isoform X2 [Dreissena polymorpha]
MAACEYDLDTSGGLMDEIQRLIAPPVSDDVARKQRRGPKEFKRHGKAINHDYCDSCQEGGDLVCCDRCPVSYHLQCHDPPLEDDDIPPGEWLCHRCKTAPKEIIQLTTKDDDASSTKSGSSSNGGKKYSPPPIPVPILAENPLHTLAEAAKVLNPVQFDLPKDLACTTPLPGSYKRKWWGKEKNVSQKKAAHELDNGLVPLPAKLCFVCNRSCRVSPLLPCDYCPCLFHLDCLNPPLASAPTDRWMCPNHVEMAVDDKLLKNTLVTERLKLWDMYNGRIDQHSVKMTFLKKAYRKNPPFRLKVRHPQRKASNIPAAIHEFYDQPTELMPPPVLVSGCLGLDDEGTRPRSPSEASLEDQEQWLKSVVSLQTSIAQFLARKQLERSSSADTLRSSEQAKNEKPTASVQPVQNRDFADQSISESGHLVNSDLKTKHESGDGCDQNISNGPVSSTDNGYSDSSSKTSGVSLLNSSCGSLNGDVEMSDMAQTRSDTTNSSQVLSPTSNIVKVTWPNSSSNGDKLVSSVGNSQSGNKNIVVSMVNKTNNVYTRVVPGKLTGQTSILSPRAGSQGSKQGSSVLRPNIVSGSSNTKVIALNQSQTAKIAIPGVKVGQSSVLASGNQSSSAIISLNNTLQQCLEGTADLELSKLDDKLIQILAWQRLQQLMPGKTSSTESERRRSGSINGLLTTPGLQEVQARAVLCPLSGRGEAIPMPYRTLAIGTGADMDVCLRHYGQCNFISAKHAFIFYDETSKHYELLNYSEHGTTVDNVLYSCDFSDKPATTPQPSAVVAAVRHLNKQHKPKMKADERLTTSRASDLRVRCNCKGSSSSMIGGSGAGWEGTAILHHGSYIKLGCLQFVFSIVDHAGSQPIHGVKRESMSLLKSHLKGGP